MNWPGVARWLALGLGVLLVALVATSEVVWTRGWWVFTTELVLPAFVGVAGTAVAAAAWLTSRRATATAEAALRAEHDRAGLGERTKLIRLALRWMESRRPGATRSERMAAPTLESIRVESTLLDDAKNVSIVLAEFEKAIERYDGVLMTFEPDFDEELNETTIVPEQREAYQMVRFAMRLLRELVRRSLVRWKDDPYEGAKMLEDCVVQVRKAFIPER